MVMTADYTIMDDVDETELNKLTFTVRAPSPEIFRHPQLKKDLIKRAKKEFGFMNAALEFQFTGRMSIVDQEQVGPDGEERQTSLFEHDFVVSDAP